MNLEVLAWAPSQKEWEQAITTTLVPADGLPLAFYLYENGVQVMPPRLVPHPGLNIDEVGEIWQAATIATPKRSISSPAAMAYDGDVDALLPPQETVPPVLAAPGWHINLRFHEPLAEMLTDGLEQYEPGPPDADGSPTMVLKPLFERTHFLTLFPDAVWHEAADGVPGGYMGAKGLKLFDPATVKSRTRVWA